MSNEGKFQVRVKISTGSRPTTNGSGEKTVRQSRNQPKRWGESKHSPSMSGVIII